MVNSLVCHQKNISNFLLALYMKKGKCKSASVSHIFTARYSVYSARKKKGKVRQTQHTYALRTVFPFCVQMNESWGNYVLTQEFHTAKELSERRRMREDKPLKHIDAIKAAFTL